jgi:Family of unknown function (DUF6247)
MRIMSALPVDPTPQEDPLDPESILRALPERERETFLAEYRRAVDDARDPARWPELRRFLRLWTWRTVAVAEPGYYERWVRHEVAWSERNSQKEDRLMSVT